MKIRNELKVNELLIEKKSDLSARSTPLKNLTVHSMKGYSPGRVLIR